MAVRRKRPWRRVEPYRPGTPVWFVSREMEVQFLATVVLVREDQFNNFTYEIRRERNRNGFAEATDWRARHNQLTPVDLTTPEGIEAFLTKEKHP